MVEFKVLKCLLEENYDALLQQFGIDKKKTQFQVEKFLGRKMNKPKEEPQVAQNKTVQSSVMQSNLPVMSAEGAADFFSQLGQQDQQVSQPNQSSGPPAAPGGIQNMTTQSQGSFLETDLKLGGSELYTVRETISKNSNWDEGHESIIKQNLLIGNLEMAAEVALKSGRTTEALLIAEAGGSELFNYIKESYFA